MTSNVYFVARPLLHQKQQFCNCLVWGKSTMQHRSYKNGPASKFMFEVISLKTFSYENHAFLTFANDR